MSLRKKTTWLLVGDASRAQLYSVHAVPLRVTKVSSGALRATRKTTRGPAHQAQSLRTPHTGNGHGDHQCHEDVFVERIAATVDAAAAAGKFDSLIVVLPPKALAHFRKVVPVTAQKKIKQEIRSDWTHFAARQIEKRLAARLP